MKFKQLFETGTSFIQALGLVAIVATAYKCLTRTKEEE